MLKQEFLDALAKKLSRLPKSEVDERIAFYGEMIDDLMEEGLTEESAVKRIGSVDVVSAQIIVDMPLVKIVKNRIKPKRRLTGREVALLICAFPIWFPLLAAAFAVALSLYISAWAVIISLWTVFAAVAVSCVGVVALSVVYAYVGYYLISALGVGAGFVLAGLSIFMFLGFKQLTKGWILLSKKMIIGRR